MSTSQQKLPIIPQPQGRPDSLAKLNELLDINHWKYDIVYMDGRANHIPHALPSLYALGASPTQIQSFNDYFVERLEPFPAPKIAINEDNWESNIGTQGSYSAYLAYFDKELEKKELMEVFKKYVPMLIPGFIDAALHPLIHIGYAVEFNSKLVLAEGLAYACMEYSKFGDIIDTLDTSKADPKKTSSELLKSIDTLNPPDFRQEVEGFTEQVKKAASLFGPQIKDLMEKWNFDPRDSDLLYKKTVELTLTSVLLFCGSYRVFAPDFFYCHGVTGNHAIRTLLPHLEPKDQRRLLQIGFLSLVAMYFARFRVELNQDFVYRPLTTNTFPTEGLDWKALIDLTNDSIDDHLIKLVRSLDVIQKTIVGKDGSNYPPNLNIEAARLVVGTIRVQEGWFVPADDYD